MSPQTHARLANFIWEICNLLRGPYKRNEYRKVILPLTVLRRFDCLLEPTREEVRREYQRLKKRPEPVIWAALRQITDSPVVNVSPFSFASVLDDPDQAAPNLNRYIAGFSPEVREVLEKFAFEKEIEKMAEKNLLFAVLQRFRSLDLSPERVDNLQMGYLFEELIRIGAEQANEEAGEHFTPREVIRLMVNLLFHADEDLATPGVVRAIYDPACGTGGMLSVAEQYIREQNDQARVLLYGQDLNDEAWAVCRSDLLIKDEEAENIRLGNIFTEDAFASGEDSRFHYLLANPPFGVEWKTLSTVIRQEADEGFAGRFGAGLPRISDGSLLFLQHMLSKMRPEQDGGSRIGIVFNGSPLFSGDAGSGESEIRRWIIEQDWLEAIVALPDQLFYNTGISTYIWILTNRKEERRRGRIQLIDARRFFVKMGKSLGNKRNRIGEGSSPDEPNQIGALTSIYARFADGEKRSFPEEDPISKQTVERERIVSRVFAGEDFGFRKIVVERPLRLAFSVAEARLQRYEKAALARAVPRQAKADATAREALLKERRKRVAATLRLLRGFRRKVRNRVFRDREVFVTALRDFAEAKKQPLKATEAADLASMLSERNPEAEICRDRHGEPEPDPDLRDTERVPLTEDVAEWLEREVLPHRPDAWVDEEKTKIGYEIPLTRHFYRYEPPRPLATIEQDIEALSAEIAVLLDEVRS